MSRTSSDRRARPALVLPASLAIATVVTCCGPDEPAVDGRDSGTDAARADAGSDAAVRDAGQRRDGGHDAGREEPVWIPVTGLPEGCDISMAEDPEALLGALTFEPCPDLDGCRQLVVNWDSRERPRFLTVAMNARFTTDESYFGFVRGEDYGFRWFVVAGADGRVHAALRTPVGDPSARFSCWLSRMAVGARRAAVSVQVTMGGGVGPSSIGLLRWDATSATYETLAVLPPSFLGPTNFVQEIEIGDDFVAAYVPLRYDIVRVGFDGSARWVTHADGSSVPGLKTAAGEALFYSMFPSGASIMVADADDVEGRALWTPGDAHVGGIAADGTDLVWAQMYEQTDAYRYNRVELWTSPFALDAADLRPRRVATVDSMFLPWIQAAGGHAATIEAEDRLSVYSLATGRIGVLHPPSGTAWGQNSVAYLSASEIAVAPQRLATRTPEASTLRFVRYDAVPPE